MSVTSDLQTRVEVLEENLRAITDRVGGIVDQVLQKGYVPVFRCTHSGLYFPADYAKQWGRGYGIGLGPDVCSEALDSIYELPLPDFSEQLRRPENYMHPVRVTKAQMDFLLVAPDDATAQAAILAEEDLDMDRRADVIRKKQLANSPQLRAFTARFEVMAVAAKGGR